MECIYLTRRETADIMRVHPATIDNWIKAGTLKAIKLPGGTVRISLFELKAFIHGKEQSRLRETKRQLNYHVDEHIEYANMSLGELDANRYSSGRVNTAEVS
jgi:excisionase family DNA binding protein